MATLLLRLAAPMQAWGDESKYNIRQTRTEPTKSGVIGLIAAALGLPRDSEEIPKLSLELRMGVRLDQPGKCLKDFHTARSPKYSTAHDINYGTDGNPIMENAPDVTYRYYLHDACFLVGLENDSAEYLQRIANALQSPCFPLFLGRRSCPPTLPLCLGIRNCALEDALKNEKWLAGDWYQKKNHGSRLRIILETPHGETAWHFQHDEPLSFSPIHRKHAYRGLMKEQVVPADQVPRTEHDPMKELLRMASEASVGG